MVELLAADAVGDVLHVGQGINDAALLRTDHQPIEVGINHVGT